MYTFILQDNYNQTSNHAAISVENPIDTLKTIREAIENILDCKVEATGQLCDSTAQGLTGWEPFYFDATVNQDGNTLVYEFLIVRTSIFKN